MQTPRRAIMNLNEPCRGEAGAGWGIVMVEESVSKEPPNKEMSQPL